MEAFNIVNGGFIKVFHAEQLIDTFCGLAGAKVRTLCRAGRQVSRPASASPSRHAPTLNAARWSFCQLSGFIQTSLFFDPISRSIGRLLSAVADLTFRPLRLEQKQTALSRRLFSGLSRPLAAPPLFKESFSPPASHACRESAGAVKAGQPRGWKSEGGSTRVGRIGWKARFGSERQMLPATLRPFFLLFFCLRKLI